MFTGLQHSPFEREGAASESHSVSDARLERGMVQRCSGCSFSVPVTVAFLQGRRLAVVGGWYGASWNCRSVHVQHRGTAVEALVANLSAHLTSRAGAFPDNGSVVAWPA